MSRRIIPVLLLLIAIVAGCGGVKDVKPAQPGAAAKATHTETVTKGKATVYPITVKDAIGRDVVIPAEPKRVLSVAPANTELTFALGKGDRLVGRSEFDDYPAEAAKIPSVGGFFPPNYELIVATKPDLVLMATGSDPEREKLINEYKLNVFVVGAETFEETYKGILNLGVVLNAQDAAEKLVADMQTAIREIQDKVAKATTKPKVYYEVWDEPLMSAGAGTYIHDMITYAGGINIAAETKGWAMINAELVANANPDIIIASSADNLAKIKARPNWAGFKAFKDGKVMTVADANHVSRPGPRLVLGLKWFAETLHPELYK